MRLPLLGGASLAALLALLAYAADAPESAWDRVQRTGTVRIGYASEAPFAYADSMGRVTGMDPEQARLVFARLGVSRVEWVQTEFRALIPELLSGRFDMIAMGMAITPDRAREIAFSRPTFRVMPGLLVPRADSTRHGTLEGLRAANGRIAVVDGAFEIPLLLRNGIPASRLLPVPDAVTGLESVRNGDAIGLALTAPTVRHLAARSSGELVAVVLDGLQFEPGASDTPYGAFGFHPAERALREAVDAELARFVGSPEQRALGQRFGFSASDMIQ